MRFVAGGVSVPPSEDVVVSDQVSCGLGARAFDISCSRIWLHYARVSLFLGVLGAMVGLAARLGIGTLGSARFELGFSPDLELGFDSAPHVATITLSFALAMSLFGGVVPALRAARFILVHATLSRGPVQDA